MKILIYGIGVVGSYLAHSLIEIGHEVSVLARGRRIEELREGLKIKHVVQRKETVDAATVVSSLGKDDFYDIIFVVMQATQVQEVYKPLIENEKSSTVIFIGNNKEPKATQEEIIKNSKIKRTVLFGFLSVGGRRENGKIISIHLKKPTIHIGPASFDMSMQDKLGAVFCNKGLQAKLIFQWYNNMEGYLKTHIAIIMPLGLLAYITNFKLHHAFFKGHLINTIAEAIREGLRALEKLEVEVVVPDELQKALSSRFKEKLFIRLMIIPPIGRLAISDHCKAAKGELDAFDEVMKQWIQESGIDHPAYSYLWEKVKEAL